MIRMGALLSTVLTLLRPNYCHRAIKTWFNVPLPPRIHGIISESEINKYRRVFVIGDVHGCAEELQRLLEKAKANNEETLKIFTGDMINKGPDSAGVLQMLQSMPHFAVRGNNEEAVLREYCFMKEDSSYCFRDKYKWVEKLTVQDIDYLVQLPYSLSIPSLNSIIVHAGLVPGKSLDLQQPHDMVSMRNIVITDYFDEVGIQALSETDVGSAWAPLWRGPQHVYFGHDAMRRLQRHDYATGLDTGCVYGGQLTGIFIHGERKGEIVSVCSSSVYKISKADTTSSS